MATKTNETTNDDFDVDAYIERQIAQEDEERHFHDLNITGHYEYIMGLRYSEERNYAILKKPNKYYVLEILLVLFLEPRERDLAEKLVRRDTGLPPDHPLVLEALEDIDAGKLKTLENRGMHFIEPAELFRWAQEKGKRFPEDLREKWGPGATEDSVADSEQAEHSPESTTVKFRTDTEERRFVFEVWKGGVKCGSAQLPLSRNGIPQKQAGLLALLCDEHEVTLGRVVQMIYSDELLNSNDLPTRKRLIDNARSLFHDLRTCLKEQDINADLIQFPQRLKGKDEDYTERAGLTFALEATRIINLDEGAEMVASRNALEFKDGYQKDAYQHWAATRRNT